MVQLLFYLIILLITLIMSTEKEIKNEATVVASAEQTANAEVQTPKNVEVEVLIMIYVM